MANEIQTAQASDEAAAEESFLEQYARTYRFTHGRPASIKLAPEGDAVLFLRSGPRSFVRDLYEFSPADGSERVLLTAERLLGGGEENLSDEELARRERMRLAARGIASYELSDDGEQILVPISGRLFIVNRGSGAARELVSEAGYAVDPHWSPDGRYVATVRDGDLYVFDITAGREHRLTAGAGETLTRGLAEFVAQEEMGRMRGYWWSPNSRWLAYQETDASRVEEVYIANPADPGEAPRGQRYPRPGKTNADVRLGVISRDGGATTWVAWDREQYPYLATVVWAENAPLTILVQNRTQTEELLLSVDPATGATSELLRETDSAWLNLDQDVPHWLSDGESFLWTSERDGARRLELRDRRGELKRALTAPELGYRGLIAVDEAAGAAYLSASDDPTQTHVYRVHLEESAAPPERMTTEPGVHGATFAERGGLYVHTMFASNGSEEYAVRQASGAKLGSLKSVAEQPPRMPKVEWTTVGDPPMHASLVRPADFLAGQQYPVIVHVYGGPTATIVTATPRRYLLEQWIADQGFIVVSVEGRGTPNRGRAWERAIKGNFIDLPLTDQVRGLEALGAKYKELDLKRVGIFGWSFGGYLSAMAVMQRPGVFHAGVAGAPPADWHDYDTHYTERYLGLPDEHPEAYAVSSVLTYADQLKRPLLVIHGTEDDNVFFQHSIKITDALFRAGKSYDFLALNGFTHMVPDALVMRRLYTRIAGYFAEHLQPAGAARGD